MVSHRIELENQKKGNLTGYHPMIHSRPWPAKGRPGPSDNDNDDDDDDDDELVSLVKSCPDGASSTAH